jgi:hypothetical protein
MELPERWIGELPRVTVQLPVYNEANVIGRLIDRACSLDYPSDRLEIQLLDDSTDETTAIAAARVAAWRRRGRRIEHICRSTRVGYKAGALSQGLRRARGDFLLVLDADFVPEPDLLRRLLPPFTDARVGMVQAAWGYLNESDNWLTRAQALLLDAHFHIEQEARFRSGLFFNSNGTAGMWRRECVEEAGGWRATTLTEDLDLSYRRRGPAGTLGSGRRPNRAPPSSEHLAKSAWPGGQGGGYGSPARPRRPPRNAASRCGAERPRVLRSRARLASCLAARAERLRSHVAVRGVRGAGGPPAWRSAP